jgi:hypothetical protein
MLKYNKKLKVIAIDERNYETLRLMGHTSDSFNDVITRILREKQTPLAPKVSSPGSQGAEPDPTSHEGGEPSEN